MEMEDFFKDLHPIRISLVCSPSVSFFTDCFILGHFSCAVFLAALLPLGKSLSRVKLLCRVFLCVACLEGFWGEIGVEGRWL